MQHQVQRFEPAKEFISFNETLASRFSEANTQTKRLILTIVGSNLSLKDKMLNIDARKPFRRWPKTKDSSTMRAFMRDVTTLRGIDISDARQMFKNIRLVLARDAKSASLDKAA
jgi:hypothetical protein